MNSKFAHLVVHETGRFMTDINGVNIGTTFEPNNDSPGTFINCRKDGIPVGPDYGWYSNGTRWYFNLWSSDGSGRLLKWRAWNKAGMETSSNNNDICKICDEKVMHEESIFLQCGHKFHYNCINKEYENSIECVICGQDSVSAIAPCNVRWLCRVVEKDIPQRAVLIRDYLGNQMWLRAPFQIYLPGYAEAPNTELIVKVHKIDDVRIDRSCHVIQYSNDIGQHFVVGNVCSNLDLPTFEYPGKNFLIKNHLIPHPLLLFPVTSL